MPEPTTPARELAVPYLDGEVKVIYLPSRITPGLVRTIQNVDASDHLQAMDGACDVLAKLVTGLTGWDKGQDDAPTPVDRESIDNLPITLVIEIFSAVVDDITSGGAGLPSGQSRTPHGPPENRAQRRLRRRKKR